MTTERDPRPRRPALRELTRARILEFVREPEAVFWVFVFPVLLAVALGIAFRSKPAGRTPVAVVVQADGPAVDGAWLSRPGGRARASRCR